MRHILSLLIRIVGLKGYQSVMANVYKFSFVPVAPAWSDPFDASLQHPARRLGIDHMNVVADSEQEAREKLVEQYTDDEILHTLEDVTLLEVSAL